MENEKRDESIFEQTDNTTDFGSGPLASAPDADEEDMDMDGENMSDEDGAEGSGGSAETNANA